MERRTGPYPVCHEEVLMRFTIYAADVTGAQDNCIYPHRYEIADAASLARAVRRDHVCARYKNNYRGNDNFIVSDCLVMDVDNDHTENPDEWITPEALAEEYPDIRFAICFSRNHMKQKGEYGPRPRFHIYFEIDPVTDHEEYSSIKEALMLSHRIALVIIYSQTLLKVTRNSFEQ